MINLTTPVADVVSLIRNNASLFHDLSSDHVWPYMINPDDTDQENVIVVVSELPRRGHTYGNGIPISERRRIQLTFYYPRDWLGDMEGLEHQLQSFLIDHDYYCYSNAGHTITPDGQAITNILKFNFLKELV